jgi:hypothetical protein
MALNLPFVIHHPPELREALLHLAEQMVQIATAQHPPSSAESTFSSFIC